MTERKSEKESGGEREVESDREPSVAVLRCSCQVSEVLQKMAGVGGRESRRGFFSRVMKE